MASAHPGDSLLAAQRESGAQVVDGRVIDFGDPAAELAAAMTADLVADIGDMGVVEVSGADAPALLQGQLTADLRTLTASQSLLSAWCNPQGRALALFRVVRRDDGFLLTTPREMIEPTIKRLRMFVLRARVTIDDASEALRCIGIAGSGVASKATSMPALPDSIDTCVRHGDVIAVRVPGAQPRWQLIGPPASLARTWRELSTTCRTVGSAAWSLLDVLAALPQVFAATRERFIPLTLNLDALGAIGFKKGCYTGQEIIARMKYRGHLKQRMHIGRVKDGRVAPAPGMRLAIAGAEMSVGDVVQASVHPDGGFVISAIVTTELLGHHAVHLDSAAGPAIEWLPLPYPLDQD